MPFPKALARFNRRVLNRAMLVLAPIPPFAALTHRGRRTGRQRRIVVNAFPCDDGFLFALVYGVDSDWVQNVLETGSAELEWRRTRIHLHRPRLVGPDEARRCVPRPFRAFHALAGVRDHLVMERAGSDAA